MCPFPTSTTSPSSSQYVGQMRDICVTTHPISPAQLEGGSYVSLRWLPAFLLASSVQGWLC